MLYYNHMNYLSFFRAVLGEAYLMTWRNKGWWLLGVLAFFLSGTIGYQLATRGMNNLANPVEWMNRWQTVSAGASPWVLFVGQWRLLTSDPASWFTLVGVWLIIGLILFALLCVSAYAVTVLISAVKVREQQGELSFILATREAWFHARTVVAVVILTQFVSNIVLALFSLPVLALTVYSGGILAGIVSVLLYVIYALVMAVLAMWVVLTLVGAILYDLPLFKALRFGWVFFWRHWRLTTGLFLSQVLITVIASFILIVLVSFIVIPVTIIGYLLVANQQYDISQFLPNLILLLTFGGFFVFGSAYTVFQLFSWTLAVLTIQEQGTAWRVSIEEISL